MDTDKMFEGRWRIKGNGDEETKRLCRDFFEAGILLREETKITTVDFEEFWTLYDKKVAKPKCEKLWEKLSAKEKNDCMAYIPIYRQAQPEKQYRKNPETFLRNKSWNDEIIYRNGNKQSTTNPLDKLTDILTD